MIRDFSKKYLSILTSELVGLNLTRIDSFDDFYNKQILDSVIPYQNAKMFKKKLDEYKIHLDIGFGGGFPLLPLAYVHGGLRSVGIEARAKKAKAVELISERLELLNVSTHHIRVEDLVIDVEVVITLKAVGTVADYLSKLVFTKKIVVFFYKGPKFYELENIKTLLADWKIIEEFFYDVEGTEGRMMIGFSPKNVPHGTIPGVNKKNKNLVYLSQIL